MTTSSSRTPASPVVSPPQATTTDTRQRIEAALQLMPTLWRRPGPRPPGGFYYRNEAGTAAARAVPPKTRGGRRS